MLMECGLVTVSVSVSPPQYSALILTSFSPPPVSAMCTHVITGHNILPLSPSPSTNVYGGDNVSNISSGPSPAASPRPDSGSVVIIVRASLIYNGFLLLLYSLTTVQDLERSMLLLGNHRHILVLLLAAGREHLRSCFHYHNVSCSLRSHSAPCCCWAPGRCSLSPLSRCPPTPLARPGPGLYGATAARAGPGCAASSTYY